MLTTSTAVALKNSHHKSDNLNGSVVRIDKLFVIVTETMIIIAAAVVEQYL